MMKHQLPMSDNEPPPNRPDGILFPEDREFYSQTFYKWTKYEEKHNAYQYHDGLNKLDKEFDSSEHCCVPGGLYFIDSQRVEQFMTFGVQNEHVSTILVSIAVPDTSKI